MAKKFYRTEAVKGPLMRLSYAQSLRKGRANDAGVEKFGCTLIIPKADAEGLKKLQAMVAEVVKGEWGEKGVERFKQGLIKNSDPAGDGKERGTRNRATSTRARGRVRVHPPDQQRSRQGLQRQQPVSDDEIVSGWLGLPGPQRLCPAQPVER